MNKITNIKRQIVQELHKSARKNFLRRHVIIKGLKDLYQADLIEMIPFARLNKGFKYILVVMDTFSKFLWGLPIKSKSAKDVTAAMKKILTNNIPKNLQTDNGKEFYNREFQHLMKSKSINHYSTYSSMKASIIERLIRTLKTLIWKKFSLQGHYSWLKMLPEVIDKYNSTPHTKTGKKPSEVTKKNEQELLKTVYSQIKIIDPKTPKYKIDDNVRVSKYRHQFEKGYLPGWSNEIFTISKVQSTFPRTYLLKDKKNEEIKGGFYEYELQKVKHPDIYLVEKVLKRKGDQVLVKWYGFPSSENSWISKTNVE